MAVDELKRPEFRSITEARADQLVIELVAGDERRAALLIELLAGVIDEAGDEQRAGIARSAMERAFAQTRAYQTAFCEFLQPTA
jgi:hypothetical protein